MLMLGTEELAKAMYDAWKKRMDVVEPVLGNQFHWSGKQSDNPRPRPRWEHLTSIQQSVWRDVARDIGGVLADAMGAV